MTSTTSNASSAVAPVLSDLESPQAPIAISLSGPPVPPQQRLYFYSSDEWEQFIREWATGLATTYVQIKRLGGPNDRGVDVAAFKTTAGFDGPWDCFQGKHYARALKMSDALPEILKLLVNVAAGHYVLPDQYAFIAPQGCGSAFNRLLSRPSELKDAFLHKTEVGSDLISGLSVPVSNNVRLLAQGIDFSIFRSVEILDALEVHRRTPYYIARFGGPLNPRPNAVQPPVAVAEHEARYVAQLIDVYSERHPEENFTESRLSAHAVMGKHFQRQRISFYNAESLRLYARDSVPEGTFEALQDDIHAGVIEVAESNHVDGMERLSWVLTTSGQLDLSSHTLISVSNLDDRKGICHQLANEDRLNWIGPNQ